MWNTRLASRTIGDGVGLSAFPLYNFTMTEQNGKRAPSVPVVDPYSNADVYYGDEDSIARIRDRRRAFSAVSRHSARIKGRRGV